MLMKSNDDFRPETKITQLPQNRSPQKSHSFDEPSRDRSGSSPQIPYEDWESNYSESSMIFRMTLVHVLLGITPLLIFLLILYLVPDFLQIDITP